MSTCPEKDIHSIYLDNELPLSYIASYEAHVASCSECQKRLNMLRAIRQSFKDDAQKSALDKAKLDQGFERLQTKLSYSRVTGKHNVIDFSKAAKSIKYIAGGIAAAAVIAFIVPLRQQNVSHQQPVADFTPVARPVPMTQNYSSQVKFNGNVNSINTPQDNTVHTVSQANTTTAPDMSAYYSEPSVFAGGSPLDYYVISGSPYEQDYNYTYQVSSLASYDVFGPEPPDYRAMQERTSTNSNGFTLNIYSPFAQFSLTIGNSK